MIKVLHIVILLGYQNDTLEYYVSTDFLLRIDTKVEDGAIHKYKFYSLENGDIITNSNGNVEYKNELDFGEWEVQGTIYEEEELIDSFRENGLLHLKFRQKKTIPGNDHISGGDVYEFSSYSENKLLDEYLKSYDLSPLGLRKKVLDDQTILWLYSEGINTVKANTHKVSFIEMDQVSEREVPLDFFDKYIKLLQEFRNR